MNYNSKLSPGYSQLSQWWLSGFFGVKNPRGPIFQAIFLLFLLYLNWNLLKFQEMKHLVENLGI